SLIKAMTMIQSQSTSNPCSIAQEAAQAALESPKDFLKLWIEQFRQRRDFVVKYLNEIPGITCLSPQGAFYVYANCLGLLNKVTPSGLVLSTDQDVCRYLLDTEGVAMVSGDAFGLSPYFRI